MKTLFQILVLGFGFLFLTSCQDVVQIKLDQGSKLYVIDAFVNDIPGPQTIRVTTNDSYFANRVAPSVVGAVVILKDLTVNKQYTFSDAGGGNYICNPGADTMSLVGHQYQLNITIDGYTYTSLATQKRTALIDSISATYNDGNSGFGPGGKPRYYCVLWAKDKVDANTDYYWIKTYRNDTLFSGSGDINICIDGTGGAVTEASRDSTFFTPPASLLGFKPYQSGNTCKVEIHSISEATYFFFTQAQAQINNGGLFATTPENVKTNISTPAGAKTKAVGWFNMATVASKQIVIP